MNFIKICNLFLLFLFFFSLGWGQEIKSKNSKTFNLSGRVQFQHLYSNRYASQDSITHHGFKMRRVRLQFESEITPYLFAKVQVEVRDNSPRLKDAEGKLLFFNKYYLRFGQYKVPVWREEFLRSSGDLILVERSNVADFLVVNLLSARHIGVEVGGNLTSNISFIFNYSNGSGEGISEIEKLIKQGNKLSSDINNGKMWAGRVDVHFNKNVQLGLSGVVNYLGSEVGDLYNKGENIVVVPDFGIYLPSRFDLEGGVAMGSLSKYFIQTQEDEDFLAVDFSCRWKRIFAESLKKWGGLCGIELAASVSSIKCDANALGEKMSYRLGPAFYFAKKTRCQTNLEVVDPVNRDEEMFWQMRTQFTVNF
mgnify:CR=1 FL=1